MTGKDDERAEILDNALLQLQKRKATLEDSLRANPEAELRPLLETAEHARALLVPESPSSKYVEASEARLRRRIREAARKDQLQTRAFSFSALWARIPSTAVAFVLVAAAVLASGWGVSSASAQAIPGDTLYPVKLRLEEASLSLSLSDTGDVALLAKFTDERLEEVEELVQTGRDAYLEEGFIEYEKSLDRLDTAMEELPADSGTDQLEDIQTRLEHHASVLISLRDQLPTQAQGELDRIVERSKRSKDLVDQLRENQGPENLPPGQEKKTTTDDGKLKPGDGNPTVSIMPLDQTPALKNSTKTPKPTNTEKLTKTPKPTDPEKPTEIPKPTDPEKPTKIPKPIDTEKPTKIPKPIVPVEPIATSKPPKEK